MMRMRESLAGLVAVMLILALGSGTLAQAQSPPPWLGGRVEMPEHGFAVTLPDDWVGLDTAADALGQRDAASDFLDPLLWSTDDDTEWEDGLAKTAFAGYQLWSGHATREESCGLGSWISDVSAADTADSAVELYSDNPDTQDVEPARSIELPAGPAYLIRMTERAEPDSDEWWPASSYVLGADGVLFQLHCVTDGTRPDDDWLSIVDTIEFLPFEEPSPPPWLGGRVELPEHGFAVTLPDDWAGFDTKVDVAGGQRAAAAGFLDPVVWSTDESAWSDGLAGQASQGIALWAAHATSTGNCDIGLSPLDMSFGEAAFYSYELYTDPEDDDTREVRPRLVPLPTGTAYHIRFTRRTGSDPDEWRPASYYLIDVEGVLVEAYCDTQEARPEDDWYSIVETIEHLPAPE